MARAYLEGRPHQGRGFMMASDSRPGTGPSSPVATSVATPVRARAGLRAKLRRSPIGRAWRLARTRAKELARASRNPAGRFRAALQDATLARLVRLQRMDPRRALVLTRRVLRIWPRARFLLEAEGLLVARLEGWAKATPLFERLAVRQSVLSAPSAGATLIGREAAPDSGLAPGSGPGSSLGGVTLALPAPAPRPAWLAPAAAAEIVLYTAVFGDTPPPAALMQRIEGLRCLCLSDRALEVPGWETVPITPPVDEPARAAAWCKLLPHKALAAAAPGARASLYVAPEMRLIGNLHTLLVRWLAPQPFALWRHPRAQGWQDLAAWHLTAGADTGCGSGAAGILAQARAFEAADLPDGRGAWDSRMLWRRHGEAPVAALMEAWWAAFEAQPGADDLALAALMAAPAAEAATETNNPEAAAYAAFPATPPLPPVMPAVLPALLGSAEDNAFFLEPPQTRPSQTRPVRSAALPAPGVRTRRRVAFLYAERYASTASTFLRGGQLSELVAEHYPDALDVTWTSDAGALRDQVVILTKGALQVMPAPEIAALRARNIAVVGSWDDVVPEPDKVAALSAHMTLSHRQMLDFSRAYPKVPAFHVTHHVNRQVPPMTPPADRLRTGYFGLLDNTVRPETLAGMVELVGISTSTVESSWIDALPRFNCHWIIRRKKPIDGWKPFLKGFLAARCGAVLVVAPEEDDALQYLGDDYPFFVRGLTAPELEADMAAIASAFGGPEWRQAQAIMAQVAARSTDAVVAAEFRAMVAVLAG